MNEPQQRWVARTADMVRERMADQQAAHGLDHIVRVVRMARQIQAEVGGDRIVIELAAWLHDIGDAKFHQGLERSGEFAREILEKVGAVAEIREQVVHIVDAVSFRKGVDGSQLSLEGQIVQDADRLDAMGAIGIVRTIEYGASLGQPFHRAGLSGKTGIDHFDDKLLKLRALMNTEPGRRLAADRDAFMRAFLEQFHNECGQLEPGTDIDDHNERGMPG
jgi:uncharacterized protein